MKWYKSNEFERGVGGQRKVIKCPCRKFHAPGTFLHIASVHFLGSSGVTTENALKLLEKMFGSTDLSYQRLATLYLYIKSVQNGGFCASNPKKFFGALPP